MLQVALDSGLWNRVMGGVEYAALFTTKWILKVAEAWPISVKLTESEAAIVHDTALKARNASKLWVSGAELSAIDIPKLAIQSSDNIDGGEPGPIQASLIIGSGDDRDIRTKFQFSMGKDTPLKRVLEKIDDYMEETRGKYEAWHEFLTDLKRNWETGRGDWILPDYMIERIDS